MTESKDRNDWYIKFKSKIMANPKVSILVAVYKVPEKFLRRCIESCTNQTLKEIEIILVDDGSPDNCGAICDSYAKEDKRIKVIHKPNGGLSSARNAGLDAATGDTVTFVDGDDFLHEDTCRYAYEVMQKEDVELVFWDLMRVFNNTHNVEHVFRPYIAEKRFDKEGCRKLQARVIDFEGRFGTATSKLINRSLIGKTRFVEKIKQGVEGFVFNILYMEKMTRAYYIAKPFYNYVYNDQSITHTPDPKNNFLIIEGFKYIEDFAQTSKNEALLLANLYTRVLYAIVTIAISGYFSPCNQESYKERVTDFKSFMKDDLVSKSMEQAPRACLDKQRKVVLKIIDFHLYPLLDLLGKIRKIQMKNK